MDSKWPLDPKFPGIAPPVHLQTCALEGLRRRLGCLLPPAPVLTILLALARWFWNSQPVVSPQTNATRYKALYEASRLLVCGPPGGIGAQSYLSLVQMRVMALPERCLGAVWSAARRRSAPHHNDDTPLASGFQFEPRHSALCPPTRSPSVIHAFSCPISPAAETPSQMQQPASTRARRGFRTSHSSLRERRPAK